MVAVVFEDVAVVTVVVVVVVAAADAHQSFLLTLASFLSYNQH